MVLLERVGSWSASAVRLEVHKQGDENRMVYVPVVLAISSFARLWPGVCYTNLRSIWLLLAFLFMDSVA